MLTAELLGTGNAGLGGYVDVGCLRYSFFPNQVIGVFGTSGPANPSVFWTLCIFIKGSSIEKWPLKLLPFHTCAQHIIVHDCLPGRRRPIFRSLVLLSQISPF